MNRLNRSFSWRFLLAGLLLSLLIACRSQAEAPPTLVMPTAVVTIEAGAPETLPTLLPSPTPLPTTAATPTTVAAAPTATATPVVEAVRYEVAFVAADDELNVRAGPGVANNVVGVLRRDATGLEVTGSGQLVAGSTWVPVAGTGVRGWVNSRFLTQTVEEAAFCQDEAVTTLLEALQTAVTNRDGQRLAQLVHPERGLRVRHSWWNPEVRLGGAELPAIFTSNTSYDWGVEDGSGFAITGPFNQEILPLLDRDLLRATESACNEILHGGTAGFVRLPDGYEAVNYYSFHRLGTEQFDGMDWGTWVVGVERWQGQYYVSYLVHFAWEI